MMRNARSARSRLLAAVAVGALAAGGAVAEETTTDALDDKIEALEAELDALREAVNAQSQKPAIETTLDPTLDASPEEQRILRRADDGEGFMMGSTRVKYGGIIDLDVHATYLEDGADFASDSIGRDFYIPGLTPTGGDGEDTPDIDFTAQASRFFFTTDTNVDGNKIGTRLEFDFLGSLQGNERVSGSFSPRLRRAYFTVNNWLFGQEWSTFQILQSIPESASFLVASDGMVFIRQAQVRVNVGPFQFALENPNTTVTSATGGRIVADDSFIPDGVVRYNTGGDWGSFSVAAIGRGLAYDGPSGLSDPTIDDEAFGIGGVAGGRLNFRGGDFRWQVVGGQGLGRYVGLNATNAVAIDPATGELEPITSYGGLAAVQVAITPEARFNTGVSYLAVDNDDFLDGTTALESVGSVFGNVMYTIAPNTSVGFEVLVGQRENENGDDGMIARSTFSAKRAF